MKKELLRHIEILKTVPEIKESIEELKFGCVIYQEIEPHKHGYRRISYFSECAITLEGSEWDFINSKKQFKIIGQIEERHLRMFGKDNGCNFCISWGGEIFRSTFEYIDQEPFLKMDEKKPYMEQSEKFFKKLNDWICKEFNINL